HGLLVCAEGAGIVTKRLEREAERVNSLDVRGIDPERRVECLSRRLPVVLNGEELSEVVVDVGRLGPIPDALLELDLRRVESPDDHQVATENLVRFGVADIERERLRQRLNRLADLLLREQRVAE